MNSTVLHQKKNFICIKKILNIFFPKESSEINIFLIFFCFYFSYSLYLALNTSIIDITTQPYDLYFSFDNPNIFHYGYDNIEGHPLLVLFTKPLLIIGWILIDIFNSLKAKTIFIVFMCSFFITMSTIYIYRYLKNIIQLENQPLYLLVCFFAFLSTNLILCFTFESFTLSSYLLTLSIYYYSYQIKEGKKILLWKSMLISFALGGVTITNFSKGILPIFFSEEKFIIKVKKALIIIFCFSLLIVFLDYQYDIFHNIFLRYEVHTKTNTPFYKLVIDCFLGSPVIMPNLKMYIAGLSNSQLELKYNGILTDYFHSTWQYLFVCILLFLLFTSIFFNRNNKLVLLISSLWCVDIVLHIILKYGIQDSPFIYGSHWVYIIPLLLGWLYKAVSNKKITKISLYYILSILTIALIINNLYRLNEFIYMSRELFPIE